MALYKVQRTDVDNIAPGDFIDAYVIAGGTGQARKAVAHMSGVTAKNVSAVKVDLTKDIRVLSAYWDERTPEPIDDHGTIPLF